MATLDPELDVAVAALAAEDARFVVVGGFSVIANRFVRATEDIDFLVPDDAENDRRVLAALRKLDAVRFRDDQSLHDDHLLGQTHLRAKTQAGIVGFKRLADRPHDRNDLIGLAEIHGELPVDPIPGLDT